MDAGIVLNQLNKAHIKMLDYQYRHHIVRTIENIDWFDIMAELAIARMEYDK